METANDTGRKGTDLFKSSDSATLDRNQTYVKPHWIETVNGDCKRLGITAATGTRTPTRGRRLTVKPHLIETVNGDCKRHGNRYRN